MLANRIANRYTIIDSHLGILAFKVAQETAIQTIYANVDDEPPISEVLDILETPPDPAAWRTAWANATAVELSKVDAKLDDAATIEEVRNIRDDMDAIRAKQVAFLDQMQVEAKIRNRREIMDQLKAEHTRLVQALADDAGIDFEDALPEFSRAVWQYLQTTELYAEFCRLGEELN